MYVDTKQELSNSNDEKISNYTYLLCSCTAESAIDLYAMHTLVHPSFEADID